MRWCKSAICCILYNMVGLCLRFIRRRHYDLNLLEPVGATGVHLACNTIAHWRCNLNVILVTEIDHGRNSWLYCPTITFKDFVLVEFLVDVIVPKYCHPVPCPCLLTDKCNHVTIPIVVPSHNWQSFFKFLVDTCHFMGPPIPLFWTFGDVSSGFQSHSGQPYLHLAEVYRMYIPWD